MDSDQSLWPDVRLGIKPSETKSPTLDEMRAAIKQGEWHSALIHALFVQADIRGLNGEDRYTLLAYHALVSLEQYHQRTLQLASHRTLVVISNVPQT